MIGSNSAVAFCSPRLSESKTRVTSRAVRTADLLNAIGWERLFGK
jgi:hypothetical protein